MAKKTISNVTPSVQLNINTKGANPTVSSRDIALKFQKKHSHMLRDIKRVQSMVPKEFFESNFGLSEYTDSTGRKLPCYQLSRDAFTLIAMGFTGKTAIMWKLRYIEAFNTLEYAVLQDKKSIIAKNALKLSPAQWERLRKVVAYRKRSFTYHEISKVMDLHMRCVSNFVRQARDLGLLEDSHALR